MLRQRQLPTCVLWGPVQTIRVPRLPFDLLCQGLYRRHSQGQCLSSWISEVKQLTFACMFMGRFEPPRHVADSWDMNLGYVPIAGGQAGRGKRPSDPWLVKPFFENSSLLMSREKVNIVWTYTEDKRGPTCVKPALKMQIWRGMQRNHRLPQAAT